MVGYRRDWLEVPPVLIGSYLDIVINGGRFDGALGMLAALEVIETLNDLAIETELQVAFVNWTYEEGVRIEPATTCAGAAASP